MGRSQVSAVRSHLVQALLHDLKAEAWPHAGSQSDGGHPGQGCGAGRAVTRRWRRLGWPTGPVLNARVRPWRVALRGETSAIDEGPKTEADAAGPRESRLCRVKGRPPAVYRLRRGARSFFFIHEMTALVRSLPRSA